MNNFKIAMGIMLFVVTMLIFVAVRRENWGVFGHRGTLRGIDELSRSHYTLEELDQQNPSDYWNNINPKSIYDMHIQDYHSKRFDPNDTQ
jgi:hypothetical protein